MNNESFDGVREYFKTLGKITREINREELLQLWKKAKQGDSEAKNKLLEMNLRLVIPTAKRFLRPNIELMDLIEEGNLGLLQAIDKFEPERGYRFSTYAVYWIEQYIRRYIEEQSGSIKIPSHAWGNLKKWFKVWDELKAVKGREPSLKEMSEALDLTARQVKSIVDTISAAKGVDSLNTTVFEEEETTLEDMISDDGKGNPHDVVLKKENQRVISDSMQNLSERDRLIIIMRYGLEDNEPKTLGEISEILGLSRERVRQIEERAVMYLRKNAQKAGILEKTDDSFNVSKLHQMAKKQEKTNILGETKKSALLTKLLKNSNSKTKAPKKNKKGASKK